MKFLAGLILLITVMSCKEPTSSGAMDQAQLANIFCDCSKPILEYNIELKALADSDNIGALTAKMSSGDQILKTAELCITDQLKTSSLSILNNDLNNAIVDRCKLDQRMIDDLIAKVKTFDEVTFK